LESCTTEMSLKNDVHTYVYHDDNTKFNNKFYRDLKNCVWNEFFCNTNFR
jgi:hypothetical protein